MEYLIRNRGLSKAILRRELLIEMERVPSTSWETKIFPPSKSDKLVTD